MLVCVSANVDAKPSIVSTGSEILDGITPISTTLKVLDKYETTVVIEADQDTLKQIAIRAHDQGKCGGYFIHDTLTQARQSIARSRKATAPGVYRVGDLKLVKTLVPKVKEKNIQDFIRTLSAFKNRYYKSETGVAAAKAIAAEWRKYGPTELYNHKSWKQPSVVTTILGSKYPDEVIIVGGHLDSISGWFGGDTRAPGADDNASGISTITEVLRVLSEAKYKPLRTIKFMGYAAEEVGLRGSSEIAKDFKARGINVVGAMQLDMTNFKGSDKTIHLVRDYTNKSQTDFLGLLIDKYVGVSWADTKCGYACSDHASWHREGYPTVSPFEAGKGDMNRKIHTKGDTIEVSGGDASHAVNFAKLGIAYLLELDSQSSNIVSK